MPSSRAWCGALDDLGRNSVRLLDGIGTNPAILETPPPASETGALALDRAANVEAMKELIASFQIQAQETEDRVEWVTL